MLVKANAEIAFKRLSEIKGLKPVMPSGAMYMMCFDLANYVRLVLTVPQQFMHEACERLAQFFADHYVQSDADPSAEDVAVGRADLEPAVTSDVRRVAGVGAD
ncbi:hypothetical protein FJT64_027180 [Amphibalanus amphitrite]|uniref:Uncharacterized protein n=1 Tax=Amphibalanus amphitrite TaxID=1232801 RepID=A0A6A4VWH7_AMPAM|nr:hypothetical protein FJT64_027180 [Amphibalanus amphitrite]